MKTLSLTQSVLLVSLILVLSLPPGGLQLTQAQSLHSDSARQPSVHTLGEPVWIETQPPLGSSIPGQAVILSNVHPLQRDVQIAIQEDDPTVTKAISLPDYFLTTQVWADPLKIQSFLEHHASSLAQYRTSLEGHEFSAAELIYDACVSKRNINPETLITYLEMRWELVSTPDITPASIDSLVGSAPNGKEGLAGQLFWWTEKLWDAYLLQGKDPSPDAALDALAQTLDASMPAASAYLDDFIGTYTQLFGQKPAQVAEMSTTDPTPFLKKPFKNFHAINSFFDHGPGTDGRTTRLDGKDPAGTLTNCRLGYSCYDGHNAIDYNTRTDEVLAAASGTIVSAGWSTGGYGNSVVIQHTNGFRTRYAHLSSIANNPRTGSQWESGETINVDEKVGDSGNTGCGDCGPHLHFEVIQVSSGTFIDPYGWWGNSSEPCRGSLFRSSSNVDELGGSGFVRFYHDNWWSDSGFRGNSYYTYSADTPDYENWGLWSADIPYTGNWEVFAFVPDRAEATYVRYKIMHRDGMFTVTRHQADYRGQWMSLGTYPFDAHGKAAVILSDYTYGPVKKRLYFDTIRWENRDTSPTIRIHANLGPVQRSAKLAVSSTAGWSNVREFNVTIKSDGWSDPIELTGVPLGEYALYLKPQGGLGRKKNVQLLTDSTCTDVDFSPGGIPAFMFGDANDDNKACALDFEIWRDEYFGGPGNQADFNLDGRVSMTDFEIWRSSAFSLPAAKTLGQGWPEGGGTAHTLNAESASATLALHAPQGSYAVGDTFDVAVDLNTNGSGTTGSEVMIQYDPGVLEVIDADEGTSGIQVQDGSLYSITFINETYPSEGILWFSSHNPTDDAVFTGTGTLAIVQFRAIASITQTEVSLYYSPNWTTDSNVTARAQGQDQLQQVSNTQFSVTGGPARPEPTVSITATRDFANPENVDLTVEASDPYSQVQNVEFWASYDGTWHLLDTDADPSDEWTSSWDVSGITDQLVWIVGRATIPGEQSYSSPMQPFALDRSSPTFVTAMFDQDPTEQLVHVWVEADDGLSGINHIEMYYNTAPDGSDSGDWIYAGQVSGDSGWIDWHTDTRELDSGIHRVVFAIQDIAGNWNQWDAPDFPVITYNFGFRVYLPLALRDLDTTPIPTPPAAPSNLQATAISSTRVRLDWQDNAPNEAGFTIYEESSFVAMVAANVTSYTVEGLEPDSYYCFHIRAFNSYGNSAWTDWACATTPPLGSAISGQVAYQGLPIAGITLALQFYDGSSWSTVLTTTTQSDGSYLFEEVPSLVSGQRYYVRYDNGEGVGADNPDYLAYWHSFYITSTVGASEAGGDFDIANVPLVSPADGVTVTLPYTFQWTPRTATLSDSYELNLYDPTDGNPWWRTDPPLGYVSDYTMDGLPTGFITDTQYAWDVWLYGPDGGFGQSYQSYSVTFESTDPMTITTYSQPADGEVVRIGCTTWAECRGSTWGSAFAGYAQATVASTYDSDTYSVKRVFLYFDTSALPFGATIRSATLHLYAGSYHSGSNRRVHVVRSTQGQTLSSSDFDEVVFASGGFADLTADTWVQIPLNTSGRTWVTKGDTTRVALIHDLV